MPTAPDLAWTLVDEPESGGFGPIADVVAMPGTVVAVGGRRSGRRTGHRPDIERRRRDLGERAAPRDCAHDRPIDRLGRPRPDARRRRRRLRAPVGHRDLDPDAAGRWQAAPFDPILCAGGIAQAATSGEHAVILGTGAGDVAFAWSSDDGLKWTDRSAPFEGRLPQGVAADGTGFVAFGVGPGPAWSARSADGTAWDEPVTLPGIADGAIIGNPVVLGDEVVVFVGDPSGAIGMLRPDGNGGWRVGADQRPDAGDARPDRGGRRRPGRARRRPIGRRGMDLRGRHHVAPARPPGRGRPRVASMARSTAPRSPTAAPTWSVRSAPTAGRQATCVGALWSGPAALLDALTEP